MYMHTYMYICICIYVDVYVHVYIQKIVFLFLSRLTNTLGLPFKIVIESRITHASSSSQEALLRKITLYCNPLQLDHTVL